MTFDSEGMEVWMRKFLPAVAIIISQSTLAAEAAQVEFRFVSEPARSLDIPDYYPDPVPEWAFDMEGKIISIAFRLKVADIDNINGDFSWTVPDKLETESLPDGSRFMGVVAGVKGMGLATGSVDGFISIRTNPNGSHQISGHIWEDTPDFYFTTDWAEFGNYYTYSYGANGHWEKIANVPVPASLPLLLGGVGALAALRRRKRRATATEDSAVR